MLDNKDKETASTIINGQAGADASYILFFARLTIFHEYFVKHIKMAKKGRVAPEKLAKFSDKLATVIKTLVENYGKYLMSKKKKQNFLMID